MLNSCNFSCCLVGGDTLLTQCGELLLSRGHSICRVITSNPAIMAWAARYEIDCIDVDSDYTQKLKALDFDYLFAITHLAKIPEEAIASPSKMAINFHDGPLPRYAGLNTPMWALLNGELSYGITWHVMANEIDQGDMLIQQSLPVEANETALSLNTKCFAAAIESFPQLLAQLEEGHLTPKPQDLADRNLYLRSDRPHRSGLIDWRLPASKSERMVRALHTSQYDNPLAAAKVVIEEAVYLVDAASVVPNRDDSLTTSGNVLEASESQLTVSCAADALELKSLRLTNGAEIPLRDVIARHDLHVGVSLVPDPQILSLLDAMTPKLASAESAWLQELAAAEAITLPYRSATAQAHPGEQVDSLPVSIPAGLAADSVDGTLSIAAVFSIFLSRITGSDTVCFGISGGTLAESAAHCPALLSGQAFATLEIAGEASTADETVRLTSALGRYLQQQPWLRDLVARQSSLRGNVLFHDNVPIPVNVVVGDLEAGVTLPAELTLRIAGDGQVSVEFLPSVYSLIQIERLVQHFQTLLAQVSSKPDSPLSSLELLDSDARVRLVDEVNSTEVDYDRNLLMHSAFERLADTQPDAIALVCGTQSISYAELNHRANLLAAHLQASGIGAETLVGVHTPRSIELVVSTLAVLKSGAAYVPLDPAFPKDRIEFMIDDSAMPVIISHSLIQSELPSVDAKVIAVDVIESRLGQQGEVKQLASPDNLSYVIYTSGSTGKPKGVMIEHRNAVNFFTAMDAAVPDTNLADKTWMAVTSLSFDISVLELFWTLNRGYKVVIFDEVTRANEPKDSRINRSLDMSLFMWGDDDAAGADKYRLLMEGAKYFDENGFAGVWTPERHFHAFGGLYPNPAVTGAAVAAVTEHVKIRAGSCVVPLHHPARIAEEWGVVDNLSNGRVEIAAASGWNPTDFVLRPENHADNKKVMYEQLDQVRRLWRGESLAFPGPFGKDISITSLPRPIQPELPCWITTAGNPETWQEAGRLGLNVLTHLLGQSVEEVQTKIELYREARKEAGFDPDTGRVALMLHTFVGEHDESVRDLVRQPMKNYLASSMRLAMDYAWSFPAFKRPGGEETKPDDVDLKSLSDEERDVILNFAFERYFDTSGLFGTEETCLDMLARCANAGVDEIACLMDFGVATETVMESLPRLKSLRDRMLQEANAAREVNVDTDMDLSFAGQVAQHNVTHLQCTPSAARMYLTHKQTSPALAQIPNLLLGGEALPIELARDLIEILPGNLTNMYGPTETTIWSMTSPVKDLGSGITIGKPIANTQVYVLDRFSRPVPAGIPGELYIAGDGVARGYLNRPELTAERFVDNTISGQGRMYATGDLVAFRDDGQLDFLGRTDFQVKVRGYRIELGEIEAKLEAIADIGEAAVIVRQADVGDTRIVGYFTTNDANSIDQQALRAELRESLPEYMVPNEFVRIDYMPRTANGKLDRKALQAIEPVAQRKPGEVTAPTSELEKLISGYWKQVLKLDIVGLNDNFFDLGGHSLLVVQLHSALKGVLGKPISLTDLYQYPTIKSLADYVSGGKEDQAAVKKASKRGERRRALRRHSAS